MPCELSLVFCEHWLLWLPRKEQVCPATPLSWFGWLGWRLKLGSVMLISDTGPSILGASWGHRASKSGRGIGESGMVCGLSDLGTWLGLFVGLSPSLWPFPSGEWALKPGWSTDFLLWEREGGQVDPESWVLENGI